MLASVVLAGLLVRQAPPRTVQAKIRDYYSIYEKADSAARIALANVDRIAGDIAALSLTNMLKGKFSAVTIKVALRPWHFEQTMHRPKAGESVLVFQVDTHDPKGGVFPVMYRQKGRVMLAPARAADRRAVADVLAFAAARDDSARVAVLVRHFREVHGEHKHFWLNLIVPQSRIQDRAFLRRELTSLLLAELDRAYDLKMRQGLIRNVSMLCAGMPGDRATTGRLVPYARDDSWHVRYSVAGALSSCDFPPAREALKGLLRDENKLVRERANHALGALARSGPRTAGRLGELRETARALARGKDGPDRGEARAALHACRVLAECGQREGLELMFRHRAAFDGRAFARAVMWTLGQDFGGDNRDPKVRKGSADRAHAWWTGNSRRVVYDAERRMWALLPARSTGQPRELHRRSPENRGS
jgi:hypothetical protein